MKLRWAAPLAALPLVACTAVTGAPVGTRPDGERPPDVLFLLVDTLRADRLGCYGHPLRTSPEIDALAASGVRFDHVVAPAPWTRPSIAAMLTGRHPRELGVAVQETDMLPASATTLAEHLSASGYATFGATANPNINSGWGFGQGFDTYLDSEVVFGWFEPQDGQQSAAAAPLPRAPRLYAASREWAAAQPADTPVFAFIDVMEVHEWPNGTQPMIEPEWDRGFDDRRDTAYLRHVRQASAELGAGVEAWLQMRPDTVVVVVSDHGEGLFDHDGIKGSLLHGRHLHESQLRVPWIVWHPTWRRWGRVVEEPVTLLDVTPTLADWLGLPGLETTGTSRAAAWTGGDVGPPALPLLAETREFDVDRVGVVDTEWKYLVRHDDEADVPARELQDRAGLERGAETDQSAEQPQVVSRLAAELDALQAAFPPATPTVRSDVDAREQAQLQAIGYVDPE